MSKAPSIVILKSGQKIITVLQEVFEGEGENQKGLCLLLNHPYELSLVEANGESELQVKFSKWCPFSIDTQYRIPYDSVIAVGQPDPNLSQAYDSKVQQVIELLEQQKEVENFVETVTPEVMPNE
jgi:sporulation protein YlmC with PRC-barrel domain